jgi:hypothetical protein
VPVPTTAQVFVLVHLTEVVFLVVDLVTLLPLYFDISVVEATLFISITNTSHLNKTVKGSEISSTAQIPFNAHRCAL